MLPFLKGLEEAFPQGDKSRLVLAELNEQLKKGGMDLTDDVFPLFKVKVIRKQGQQQDGCNLQSARFWGLQSAPIYS